MALKVLNSSVRITGCRKKGSRLMSSPDTGKTFTGKRGYPMKSDKAAKAVGITDYAVLAVTGGHAPDKWRIDETIVRIVRQAFEQDLVVAAICHAAQLLIEADVVKVAR